MPPAHITHGYGDDAKLLQVGVTCVVDELAAVPPVSQCLDGNSKGHTAIRQQCDWLLAEGLLRPGTLAGGRPLLPLADASFDGRRTGIVAAAESRCHHPWKTPLAVGPVFLKSPRRVEALVCLMQVALTA